MIDPNAAFTSRTLALVCVVLMATVSRPVDAQSLENCLSATAVRAISICRILIEEKRDTAAVYRKLASALQQQARFGDALSLIAKAKQQYPGDTELPQLERRIWRERVASRRGPVDTGTRTSGVEGSADDQGLAREGGVGRGTPVDDLPGPPAAEVYPRPEDGVSATSTSPSPAGDYAAREEAYRRIVSESQQLLNELGFEPGPADGVPGRRTRDALAEYQAATGQIGRPAFDAEVLADLQRAHARLLVAQQYLEESEAALATRDVTRARSLLDRATAESSLLRIPPPLATRLDYRPPVPVSNPNGYASQIDSARDEIRSPPDDRIGSAPVIDIDSAVIADSEFSRFEGASADSEWSRSSVADPSPSMSSIPGSTSGAANREGYEQNESDAAADARIDTLKAQISRLEVGLDRSRDRMDRELLTTRNTAADALERGRER